MATRNRYSDNTLVEIDGEIYEKKGGNLKKIATKGFSTDLGPIGHQE